MALDMCLCKISKCTKNEIKQMNGKSYNDVGGNVNVISEEDLQNRESLVSEIKPFLTEVMLEAEYQDIDKIAKDNNITNIITSYLSIATSTSFTYTFKCNENGKTITKKVEVDPETYTFKKLSRFYVCKYETVCDWRDDYEVQDFIYENLNFVNNGSYSYVDDDTLAEMRKKKFLSKSVHNTSTKKIFYYEWS